MMNALGFQDYTRSRGCHGGSAPSCTSQSAPASTSGASNGGNVAQSSFSYSSSVDVNISSNGMQMAYSSKTEFSFTFSGTAAIARPAPAQSVQSPDVSADNILNFIEDRLKTLKASGASAEEMQKALDDGLSGYETGRDQAIEILTGYGMYDGPIKTGVEKTTELVQKGIEKLGEMYLGNGAEGTDTEIEAPAPAVPVSTTPSIPSSSTTPTSSTASAPVATLPSVDENDEPSIPSVSRYRAKLYNEDTLDLTVQTRDGDTITISIEALASMRANGADWTGMDGFAGLQGDGSLTSFKGMYSESMLFEVDGELDDAEKAALDDLLASVMDLADSFYGGDMTAALDKASQLELDPTELASMSLDMTQTRYMRASAATYRDVAGFGGRGDGANVQPGVQHGRGLNGLGDYVRNLRELGNQASAWMNPKDFINELFSASFAQMDAARPNGLIGLERLDALHRSLVEGALPAAEQPSASDQIAA